MSKGAKINVDYNVSITLNLTLEEANALNAITVYGLDAFLYNFYNGLGRAYLSKCEDGLCSLFHKIASELTPEIALAKKIETDIKDACK